VLREAAARAPALAGDRGAVPVLIRRLDEDPDEDVRKAAAHALGAIRAAAAAPSLLARVLDQAETHWVTAEAATALGEIGDPSVIGALEKFRTEHADFWMEHVALTEALAKLRAAGGKEREGRSFLALLDSHPNPPMPPAGLAGPNNPCSTARAHGTCGRRRPRCRGTCTHKKGLSVFGQARTEIA
jgi:hypothetical protein